MGDYPADDTARDILEQIKATFDRLGTPPGDVAAVLRALSVLCAEAGGDQAPPPGPDAGPAPSGSAK